MQLQLAATEQLVLASPTLLHFSAWNKPDHSVLAMMWLEFL